MASKRGLKKVDLDLSTGTVPLYTGKNMAAAFEHILDQPSFLGIKILQVIEAVYKQGKKDGARETQDAVMASLGPVWQAIPAKPGQPKKKPSAKKPGKRKTAAKKPAAKKAAPKKKMSRKK
jgi:hypothetical protein